MVNFEHPSDSNLPQVLVLTKRCGNVVCCVLGQASTPIPAFTQKLAAMSIARRTNNSNKPSASSCQLRETPASGGLGNFGIRTTKIWPKLATVLT
eukprot:4364114-Amphidinium_carterae.2